MMQTIQFMEHVNETSYIPTGAYKLNPKRRALWLQKACCWIMKKLDCEWFEPTAKITRIEVDPMRFMQEIFRQRESLYSLIRKDGQTLLIGADDFLEAMGSPEIYQQFCFKAQINRSHRNRWGEVEMKILGLDVVVVPWMKGMVILP